MDTFTDYYALLHVQADAPMPVIKASYRAMMQKLGHHPDKGPNRTTGKPVLRAGVSRVDRLAGQSQNHLRNERSSLTAIALAQPFQRICSVRSATRATKAPQS